MLGDDTTGAGEGAFKRRVAATAAGKRMVDGATGKEEPRSMALPRVPTSQAEEHPGVHMKPKGMRGDGWRGTAALAVLVLQNFTLIQTMRASRAVSIGSSTSPQRTSPHCRGP